MSTIEINTLVHLRSQIAEMRSTNSISEAQTKEWLIRPFFEMLGWQFSNWAEVVPEDGDEAGQRADYCFYFDKVPKVLVEAKPLKNNLNDQQMIINKLNYCSNRNIPILILTNGDTYKVFFNEIPGIGVQKLLFEFTLTNETATEHIEKLQKEYIQSDELLKYARKITVFKNVQSALNQLFEKQDAEFIKLINRNLQSMIGHKFHNDEIKNALGFFHIQIDPKVKIPPTKVSEISYNLKSDSSNMAADSREKVLFRDGIWQESFDKYSKLIQRLKDTGLEFQVNPMKHYIGLLHDKYNFAQIGPLKMGLQIWVKLKYDELSDEERKIARDVSKVGHLGMGDVEILYRSETEVETVVSLIKRSYNK